MLQVASRELDVDLTGFDFRENNFLDDEVKSQYISYIFSCSVANILKTRGVKPSFVSGYSMGIYAALYYCGTITFNDGLRLVKSAWEEISKVTGDRKYGMGMLVGLNGQDISNLLQSRPDVTICNQNNLHTYIISGTYDAVMEILSSAKAEGALRANLLPVSKPYHSNFIKNAVPGFSDIVRRTNLKDPEYKYISNTGEKIISDSAGIQEELVNNLNCSMSWYNTMNSLLKMGTEAFFECGAGDGLTRNFRFIEGRYKAYSINKLDDFLKDAQD